MKTYENFIDGRWQPARGGQLREIRDPGNGELVAKVQESNRDDVIAAIQAARKAFDGGPWRKTSALDRGKFLFKVAEAIRAQAKKLAELEVRNCGKPLAEAEFDIVDAANCFEFYGGLATKIHSETMQGPANPPRFVVGDAI